MGRPQRQRKRRTLDSDSDGEENEAQSAAKAGKGKLSGNTHKFTEVVQVSDNGESSGDIVVSRRRIEKQRSEKQRDEDEDSLLDELENLQDTEEEPQERRNRVRQDTSARSKRLECLAKLKQRRAGIVEVDSTGEDDREDEEQEDDQLDEEPFEENQPSSNKGLDNYESDFIEDDGEIGVDLMKYGVPLHLTGQANKKPFDYFKDEIEWMVHNKLDPAFERHDEIYLMAHQKLDDEIKGLAGSEFNSSVWKENFVRALKNRPDMSTMHVGWDLMQDKCDACNRSKHPPKW